MKTDTATIRDQIVAAENSLQEQRQKIHELRRRLPPENVSDYTLLLPEGTTTPLSAFFGDKNDLTVIHNMGKSCPYCTLWADGFNGFSGHLEDRAGFVLVSPDPPAVLRDFAQSRNWQFKAASAAHNTDFIKDMGFLNDKGNPMPGVSTFHKDNSGKIQRIASTYFGPGDEFCSIWHLFDLLKDGPGEWSPKYSYE